MAGVLAQNVALALWICGDLGRGGGERGLWIYAATVVVAGIVGVFSVYLQHNFRRNLLGQAPGYNLREAAFHGSSWSIWAGGMIWRRRISAITR